MTNIAVEEPTEAKARDTIDLLRLATGNYQTTARWLAGSFGAVAVALVAGLSLSELGALDSTHLLLAIAGVASGLAATAVVIYSTALVAPIEFATFEQVEVRAAQQSSRARKLANAINAEDGLFSATLANYRSTSDLRFLIARLEQELQEPGHDQTPGHQATKNKLDVANRTAQRILMFANYHEAKRAYKRLQWIALIGGLTFVGGAGLFAWASSSPADTPAQPTIVIVQDGP
jgi:hypothetical protein